MKTEMIIQNKDLKDMIFSVRGKQVMLDSSLAEIYEVETRVFNQAVKRNSMRFPDDFRFQLTEAEYQSLRSQNVILKNSAHGRGQHQKYLPFVFTEQGVAMLSAVLKSQTAVER